MSIDGILNINKPAGETSLEVVDLVRRLSGQRHIGHAGTLDPGATGVLPICLGQAARVASFIVEAHKTYQAEIELGVSTDTYDAEGKVTQRVDPSYITLERVERVLPSLSGSILQKPPMYSALKHQGKRLYELARAGIEVEREERRVEVFRLEIVDWQPPIFTIDVECGKGTYIRCLAHDLGESLGCGAHLRKLVRLRCGFFDISDSLTLPQLEDSFQHNYWQHLLYPMDVVIEHWVAAIVSKEKEHDIRNGRPLALGEGDDKAHCRAYSLDGRFLAVLRFLPEKGLWQPEKVFSSEQCCNLASKRLDS
ncbi:MAG: tRNA pseudouridine(55) synthase TruB [Dehalococcoidia bacterium]|nr:tRNA pseudouridine(55) synthase TruB [Dehalococcoidia bacterium]